MLFSGDFEDDCKFNENEWKKLAPEINERHLTSNRMIKSLLFTYFKFILFTATFCKLNVVNRLHRRPISFEIVKNLLSENIASANYKVGAF